MENRKQQSVCTAVGLLVLCTCAKLILM